MTKMFEPDDIRYFYIITTANTNHDYKSCGYRLAGSYAYRKGHPVTNEMIADAWARMYSKAPGLKIQEQQGKRANLISHEIPGRVPEANGKDQGVCMHLNFMNWMKSGKDVVWVDEEFIL